MAGQGDMTQNGLRRMIVQGRRTRARSVGNTDTGYVCAGRRGTLQTLPKHSHPTPEAEDAPIHRGDVEGCKLLEMVAPDNSMARQPTTLNMRRLVKGVHAPDQYKDDAEGETILRKEGKESYVVVKDTRGFLAEIIVDSPRGDGCIANFLFIDVIVPRTDKVAAAMRDEGSVWAKGLCTIGFEELTQRAELLHRRSKHVGRDKLEPTLACRGMQARSEDWKRLETEC
uniref:Uncharacterized protein n=1 Tax=Chromera velia CCMP2878 TaxID=1169474 RepID=A0A0G4I1Q9_9ALVE|eukprot:Cvel_10181.t1-p1 / transcript=Cvel_10181.t1 / gene=Cvel_10181 / organism=Chromera_velia_CCMP2878 / gene_product=hypothetical protein / transcript_product=hypothetical protein / location=Cvel_scaffold608:26175-27447(+) / protein_length=226 / sequence_SO=supercontig / SO=protein_coding / is_pseudo=false